MIEDIRKTDKELVTLANRLEVLIADKSVDIESADNLLNLVKVELSKATLTESTIPIIHEIERLNEIYSGLQGEQDNLNITLSQKRGKKRGLRNQVFKLKLEMDKLEQKLAELNFQIRPDPLSTVEITKRRVARLESELRRLKIGLRGIFSTKLNWEIFPSNQDLAVALKSSYCESISKRGGSIDFDRLYRIIEYFKPGYLR
jgi:chromosome segregation ATPase